MLISHVESQGVWKIKGGMSALAEALESLASKNGAQFKYDSRVAKIAVSKNRATGVQLESGEWIAAQSVICNADPSALGSGIFGVTASKAVDAMPRHRRSLSAMVWLAKTSTSGFPLDHHNVFFSSDYIVAVRRILRPTRSDPKAGHIDCG